MSDLPFVDRVINPQDYPEPTSFDSKGRPQTHLMSADIDERTGNWIVYPTLTIKDGKYVKQTLKEAIDAGDSINYGKDKEGAIDYSKNYKQELNPNFEKYNEQFDRVKKETGGEANNLQAAIDLLNNPVTSSISPLGDPTLSPLMESLQKNPIDDFAMMMADPTKGGLKVINTPIKMQLKALFAKRGKFKQLLRGQEQNYRRGQDLSSKVDPKEIKQGTIQMQVAIQQGKRFQRQLNDIEEKIRKVYNNK